VLAALAMQNASGALRITGDPSGVIYLDAGHITFAQADWVPDLAARLRELPDVPPAARALLMAGDDPDRDLGALLVESKCLTKAALRTVVKSMIIDAMIVLTLPLADETSIINTRFETPASHWAAPYSRLGIDAALTQAEKKLAGLRQTRLSLTEPLELTDLTGGRAVLKREHWQVASRIDGQTAVRELAWQCGLSLAETIDYVGYLIRKGTCAPVLAEPKSGPQVPKQAEPAAGEVVVYDFAKGKKKSPRSGTARPSSGAAAGVAGAAASGGAGVSGAAAGVAGASSSGGAGVPGAAADVAGASSSGGAGVSGAAAGVVEAASSDGGAASNGAAGSSGSLVERLAGSNGSAAGRLAGSNGSAVGRSAGSGSASSRSASSRSAEARSAGARRASTRSAAGSAGSGGTGRAGEIPAGPVRGSVAARTGSLGPDLDSVSDASQSAPSAEQLRRVLDALKKLT
jgi:hypothetical protein